MKNIKKTIKLFPYNTMAMKGLSAAVPELGATENNLFETYLRIKKSKIDKINKVYNLFYESVAILSN
jgi:hypothetical protein